MAEYYPYTVEVKGSNPLVITENWFVAQMVRCTALLMRGLWVRISPGQHGWKAQWLSSGLLSRWLKVRILLHPQFVDEWIRWERNSDPSIFITNKWTNSSNWQSIALKPQPYRVPCLPASRESCFVHTRKYDVTGSIMASKPICHGSNPCICAKRLNDE